jgi:hypothetical protein
MKSNFPTESTIRQYLLGQLDSQAALESSLSQQMLFDDELSETVDLIEEELIEDYLDNTLSAEDRKAAEEYFLRPPERREKLLLARRLRNHFDTKPATLAKKTLGDPHKPGSKATDGVTDPVLLAGGHSHFRTWCELGMMVLILAGFLYFLHVRNNLQSQLATIQKNETRLANELTQEREHSAGLTKQLQEVRPPVVALTFFHSVFRDNGGTPIEIKPWTERIKVIIDLPGSSSRTYDVRLQSQSGQELWTNAGIAGSAGNLSFDMPAQKISATGKYCLAVSSRPEPYCFHARVIRN